MSIATDEAEKKYPIDVELTTTSENNTCRRTGYIAGRTAEPTEEEVEASAFAQFKAVNNSAWNMTEEQYLEAWDALPEMVSGDFLRKARIGLIAARKVVSE